MLTLGQQFHDVHFDDDVEQLLLQNSLQPALAGRPGFGSGWPGFGLDFPRIGSTLRPALLSI